MVHFDTTNWSVVLKAGSDHSSAAREALGTLCTAYWYPVYAMVRRYGYDATGAEDMTQAYFTRFLEKGWVKELSPEHGRFRSFLLVSVRNFLHNERDRERAMKRGGGAAPVSLDGAAAEERYALEPVESETPETIFEKAWAEEVLARALERLRSQAAETDGAERFERLKAHLTGDETVSSYGELAAAWGVGESAVRAAVHRMRKRLGTLLREEIAETVADERDIGDELRHLLTTVGRGTGGAAFPPPAAKGRRS